MKNKALQNHSAQNKKLLFRLLFGLLLFTHSIVVAQNYPKRALGTYVYSHKVYNYEFIQEANDNFSFKISSFTDNAKIDTSKNVSSEKVSDTSKKKQSDTLDYVFSDFDKQSFVQIFSEQMKNKFGADTTVKALRDKGGDIFNIIKLKLDFLDDEPVTANLILKKDEIYSILKSNTSSYYYHYGLSEFRVKHHIDRVTIETEDGTIKNISVHLTDTGSINKIKDSPRKFIEFKNQYPISISSKNDADHFADINLYSFNCNGIKGLTRYIKLSDLLMLDIVLENDKDDYSPSNRVVSLSPNLPLVELKKEKRSKIIEIGAFSDFVGLDQKQPNGLIQIEAKRKINLNTVYHPFFKLRYNEDIATKVDLSQYKSFKMEIPEIKGGKAGNEKSKYVGIRKDSLDIKHKADTFIVVNKPLSQTYINFGGSIEPRLLFSKLEDNNQDLILNSSVLSENKISPIKIYQYQLASFGLNINVCKITYPQAKINWNVLDIGLYWYRTRVKTKADSASNVSTALNNGYYSIGTSIVLHPDNRWGTALGLTYVKQKIFDDTYTLANNNGLFQANFDGYLKTNDDSKLFIRFRWSVNSYNVNSNFTQIQLGYTMNIFTSHKDAVR